MCLAPFAMSNDGSVGASMLQSAPQYPAAMCAPSPTPVRADLLGAFLVSDDESRAAFHADVKPMTDVQAQRAAARQRHQPQQAAPAHWRGAVGAAAPAAGRPAHAAAAAAPGRCR